MQPQQATPTTAIGVSVKEAARITSVSQWKIRNEISAGRLPARHIGSRVAIDYDALIAWFQSHPPVVDGSEAS